MPKNIRIKIKKIRYKNIQIKERVVKMKYLEIVKKLQNLSCNTDILVLVRSGVFFYGIGKDAIILTEKLGLNCCCIKKQICKTAIPVIKIEETMKKLKEKEISFVIYDYAPNGIYEGKEEKYKELVRYISSPICEERKHFDCNRCQHRNLFDNKMKKEQGKINRILSNMKKENT